MEVAGLLCGLGRLADIADWGRVFTDVAVWRPLVQAVLRRHDLVHCYACTEVQPGERAGTHAVFVVGERWVVKIYGPFWSGDREREIALYRRFERLSTIGDGVALPRLVAAGRLDPCTPGGGGRAWPYVVTTYLPGRRLGDVWPGLTPAARLAVARGLGAALRDLHRLAPSGLAVLRPALGSDGGGPAGDMSGGPDRGAGVGADGSGDDERRRAWLEFVAQQAATARERHSRWGRLTPALLADIDGFLGRIELPRAGWRPVVMSCDVTADHVLVERPGGGGGEGWRVSGLIDFGDAMIGDPEYEFVAVYVSALGCEQASFDAMLNAYGYPAGEDYRKSLGRRLLGYMLLHRFDVFEGLPRAVVVAMRGASNLAAVADAIWVGRR